MLLKDCATKTLRASMLVIAILWVVSCYAQTIDLQGKVFNHGTQPISGATCTLLKAGNTATTGANGSFRIQKTTTAVRQGLVARREGPQIVKGAIRVYVYDAGETVGFEAFDVSGRQIARKTFQDLTPGVYSMNPARLFGNPPAQSFYLVRLQIAGKQYVFKLFDMGAGLQGGGNASVASKENEGLSKVAAAALDTLVITKSGYQSARAPIDAYVKNLDTIFLQPATGSSWTCGWGTFKAGNWPSGCWRPYADSSPFNREIRLNPTLNPNSANIIAFLEGYGFGFCRIPTQGRGAPGNVLEYGHPTFYSQPNDPEYTIHCTEPWGTCAFEGMKLRIPAGAQPANGTDHHLGVVNQVNGLEYPMWLVSNLSGTGGTLNIGWGDGSLPINGSGLGGNANAAHFGGMAGQIRYEELEAGAINHALFTGVPCENGFVYPAAAFDFSCASKGITNGQNAPPMGARIQLAMTDAQIDALAVPQWKKTIFRALAHYGMYAGDTGPAWGVGLECSSTYMSFGYPDPMVDFCRRNNISTGNCPEGTCYYLDLSGDIKNLQQYLRVLDPCEARGNCP